MFLEWPLLGSRQSQLSRVIGGAIEWFKRGQLSKQLENRVFKLEAGEVSDVLLTKQGFVILQVTEHGHPRSGQIGRALFIAERFGCPSLWMSYNSSLSSVGPVNREQSRSLPTSRLIGS